MKLPNLAGVATADLVEKIGTGKFSAAYINWARTVNLLRDHAPGWQPDLVLTPDGGILHPAPVGAYLLIRFSDGEHVTAPVPQAVMDSRNAAIPFERITARDVTDTHRRGVCMAAAFTFGLAYELWAKLPLESGYHADDAQEEARQIDVPAILRSIQNSADLEALKGHFSAAWQMLDGNDRTQAKATYDKRKDELEKV